MKFCIIFVDIKTFHDKEKFKMIKIITDCIWINWSKKWALSFTGKLGFTPLKADYWRHITSSIVIKGEPSIVLYKGKKPLAETSSSHLRMVTARSHSLHDYWVKSKSEMFSGVEVLKLTISYDIFTIKVKKQYMLDNILLYWLIIIIIILFQLN